jgi:TatA/E family protein of Tat protein translocase
MPFDGAFSPLHWLIVGLVALLVLGPEQLPRPGREVAKAVRFLQDASRTATDELGQWFEPDHDSAVRQDHVTANGFELAAPGRVADDPDPMIPVAWRPRGDDAR